jgi:heme oxygenase
MNEPAVTPLPEAMEPGMTETGLAALLREGTRRLHVQAERAGIVRDLLRGRASLAGYVLLLRNLLPAYEALEQGLERHRGAPGVRAIGWAPLFRAPALAADLAGLHGAGWRAELGVLPAGVRYAERIAAVAAADDGTRLLGHAYARYLGDLSGGQILRRLLAKSLGLTPATLAFYDFPAIADAEAFKDQVRIAFDQATPELPDVAGVVEEAKLAFQLNIEVAEAVQAALPAAG